VSIKITNNWKAAPLGNGWAWDDYTEPYMVERSMMPIYGNILKFKFINDTLQSIPYRLMDILISSDFATEDWGKFEHRIKSRFPEKFTIERMQGTEQYQFKKSEKKFESIEIPFKANNELTQQLLRDTFKNISINIGKILSPLTGLQFEKIHSQPTDSLLTPMMHRSDNFFAEQTLLMASNEHLGLMNDAAIIDSLLNNDLKDIPQRPTWVDGSGLSRYNLFTPQSFIFILNKMKNEFGLERLKKILPTSGEGTLKDYYTNDSTFIYAKTGTLGGTIALSGFLITKKNKLLVFSILTNNFKGRATAVRRAVEHFITDIRKKY
jgi:serine-type D-Ala-D-Ala carboxypeptidase/endopeptidase (penicillin-binding protein 4)